MNLLDMFVNEDIGMAKPQRTARRNILCKSVQGKLLELGETKEDDRSSNMATLSAKIKNSRF